LWGKRIYVSIIPGIANFKSYFFKTAMLFFSKNLKASILFYETVLPKFTYKNQNGQK
jgi:hypothetical protein